MTPAEIISDARNILNDTVSAEYRQSDEELLEYVNQGLREAVILNPALFSTVDAFTCVSGKCEQTLTFTDAAALIEVLCITDGAALIPFDLPSMDAFSPSWRTDTAGAAIQWAKFPNDPLRFFIYPKAPASAQSLDVRYARVPATYALSDDITDLPVVYKPALANYVASRAELKDDEHVLSERAAALYNSFATQIKG